MKKVGRDYIERKSKIRLLNYRDIKLDPEGWVDVSKYLPADYDLVTLFIKNKKNISGWIIGNKWEGLHLKPEDEILYWKRKSDEIFKPKTGMSWKIG